MRDQEVPPPDYTGRGRLPKVPFQRVDSWATALPEDAWTSIEVRDGEKGPLVVEAVKRRVQARTPTAGTGPEELLFITRERQSDGTFKHDYYLSNAHADVPLKELARVAKAEHRVEECLERAKGEAGLADYQVRNWKAWHHHQTLALVAAWFLTEETRRGKNPDPRADITATAATRRGLHRRIPQRQPTLGPQPSEYPLASAKRTSSVLPPSLA